MQTNTKCIECEKIVVGGYWFCGEYCAANCCMWTAKNGTCSPDEALEKLTIRHKEFGQQEDLTRIEKILKKMNETPE